MNGTYKILTEKKLRAMIRVLAESLSGYMTIAGRAISEASVRMFVMSTYSKNAIFMVY